MLDILDVLTNGLHIPHRPSFSCRGRNGVKEKNHRMGYIIEDYRCFILHPFIVIKYVNIMIIDINYNHRPINYGQRLEREIRIRYNYITYDQNCTT